MQRALGALTLVAAILLIAAAMVGAGHLGSDAWGRASIKGANVTIDAVSCAVGFLAGLAAVWLAKVPWSAFPRFLLNLVPSLRRSAVLMALAVLSAGVLLFY